MRAVYTFLTLFLLSQAPAALAGCAIEPDGNGHVTIPDGQTSIAHYSFSTCTGTITSVTIPDTVTSIDASAFIGCSSLTSITIPDSVTSIGINAFYGCTALTSVTIGSGVTSIDDSAFNGCSSLTSITIPDSVTSTGHSVFAYSGLTSVTIESGVTSLGANIFRGCTALQTITIPDTVTSIGNNAFYGCSALTQVCGVDATQAPFSGQSELQVQTTQAQCTESACPAGTSGVKWCTPLCTSPVTTGYQVTETSLAPDSFDVSATCATGAVGTASVDACTLSGQPYVLSGCRVTYDCASPATTGEFVLADDCTLNGEVSLTGDLDILGVVKGDGSYPVITAATSSRHFKITSGAHKLTLKYLKMTGADISGNSYPDYSGGSIYVYSVAATLNISDSEFFNNRAGYGGGAIFAHYGHSNLFFSSVNFTENNANEYGGAVFLQTGTLVDHSSTYNMNTAGENGGAFFLFYGSHASFFNSSLVSNTAGDGGGAISMYSDSSEVTLSSVTLQSNKQIGGGTDGRYGGGGIAILSQGAIANIRECTFIRNEATEGSTGDKHGHQIMTYGTPSVVIVNTIFTHIAGDNAFYGYDGSSGGADKYVSTTTCSADEACSASPFTGACADLGNEGTTCQIICPSGSGSWAPDGALSCSPHTTCGNQVGGTTRLTGESATAAGTCAACSAGTANGSGDCVCAADEKSDAGLCKKLIDCLTATEQGHRNIDIGVDSGDYTVSFS